MNGDGDCPDSYKLGVIRSYVRRALRNCSSWQLVHQELRRVRKILVDNGYSNYDFDRVTNKIVGDHMNNQPTQTKHDTITVHYKNTLTPAWKADEKAITSIVKRNTAPTDPNTTLHLNIY